MAAVVPTVPLVEIAAEAGWLVVDLVRAGCTVRCRDWAERPAVPGGGGLLMSERTVAVKLGTKNFAKNPTAQFVGGTVSPPGRPSHHGA